MRMSRASAYAISAVLQLAETPPGVPIPCSQLAKTGELPERFLLQVLRNLVNHGLLKSTRGVDGGYYLLRPASEITLLSIIEATDGPLTPVVPPLDGISEASKERLHALLRDIVADTCRQMAAVKLTDLRSAKSSKLDAPDSYFDAEAEVDKRLSRQ